MPDLNDPSSEKQAVLTVYVIMMAECFLMVKKMPSPLHLVLAAGAAYCAREYVRALRAPGARSGPTTQYFFNKDLAGRPVAIGHNNLRRGLISSVIVALVCVGGAVMRLMA